jgi:hypothetical protein
MHRHFALAAAQSGVDEAVDLLDALVGHGVAADRGLQSPCTISAEPDRPLLPLIERWG